MRRIFIPGFGYTIIMTKNPFRKRKMFESSLNKIFKDIEGRVVTLSIETDMC
jgi:hypothetical protein